MRIMGFGDMSAGEDLGDLRNKYQGAKIELFTAADGWRQLVVKHGMIATTKLLSKDENLRQACEAILAPLFELPESL